VERGGGEDERGRGKKDGRKNSYLTCRAHASLHARDPCEGRGGRKKRRRGEKGKKKKRKRS